VPLWALHPLYYGENDETMTLTLSGVARYEVKGRSIEALVTRDINNTVWLRTFLLDVVDGQETRRKGVVVKVEKEYRKGELRYSHGSPTSYDQHQNALDDIEETLELIASANTAVYGVADFSALTNEELRAIQINAEPGLRDWVDSRFYKDHPKHNPENALKA
jgi:hypothetical protein